MANLGLCNSTRSRPCLGSKRRNNFFCGSSPPGCNRALRITPLSNASYFSYPGFGLSYGPFSPSYRLLPPSYLASWPSYLRFPFSYLFFGRCELAGAQRRAAHKVHWLVPLDLVVFPCWSCVSRGWRVLRLQYLGVTSCCGLK